MGLFFLYFQDSLKPFFRKTVACTEIVTLSSKNPNIDRIKRLDNLAVKISHGLHIAKIDHF